MNCAGDRGFFFIKAKNFINYNPTRAGTIENIYILSIHNKVNMQTICIKFMGGVSKRHNISPVKLEEK